MDGADGHKKALIANFIAMISVVGIGQLVIEIRRGETPQILDLFRERPTVAHLRSFEADLEDQSWFAETLRPDMQYLRFRLLRDAGEKVIVGRDGWWFYRSGVRYLVEPLGRGKDGKPLRDEVVSAIRSFRDALAGRGIQLLVIPVPGKASVYPEMLTARARTADLPLATHTSQVMSDLRGAGVEVVDLFEMFARARTDERASIPGPYYLSRDTHWTPNGLRLAARQVARRIRDLGWAGPAPVDYDTRVVAVSREGDLVQMLRTPSIEDLFAPMVIECEQVIAAESGQVYQDDPDARILVLGDSFLRIYERDAPGSAGLIAHLARELGQPVSSIVNDGGASTLVRQELARRPDLLSGKRLVVWEFIERDIRFGLGGWEDVPLPEVPSTASAQAAATPSQSTRP